MSYVTKYFELEVTVFSVTKVALLLHGYMAMVTHQNPYMINNYIIF